MVPRAVNGDECLNEAELSVVLVALSGTGGSIQYPVQLANALGAHADVTAVVPDTLRMEYGFEEHVTIVEYDKDGNTFPANLLCVVFRTWLATRPDVVHLPFYTAHQVFLTLLLWLLRTPTIGTVHDPRSHSDDVTTVLGRELDIAATARSAAARTVDRVIVHGQETRKQALDTGYRSESIHVVPHGLYTHFRQSSSGALPEAVTEEGYVLFFGRIRENKGFDLIPEIMGRVNERLEREVRAVVAGATSKREAWSRQVLADLRSNTNVTVVDGYVSDAVVGPLFEGASVVGLPYRDSSMSGVAMIAYTFDSPMVVTDSGDLGRIVGNDGAGLVAAVDDVEEISKKIATLVDNEDCRERIRDHIRRRKEQYSWEQIAERTVEVYREAIGTKSR